MESKFPVDMHIYTFCPSLLQSFRKFCWADLVELCWQTVSVVSFIFVKFRSSKMGIAPRTRNRIKMSHGYAHLHIMSFITTKFQEILLSGFRGVALTHCFSSIFFFRQISNFKKSVIQRKKMESKFPVDMHIYTFCPSLLQSFRKFCWAVLEELR